jgi:soluble lytic murein transglycosylase-like protein
MGAQGILLRSQRRCMKRRAAWSMVLLGLWGVLLLVLACLNPAHAQPSAPALRYHGELLRAAHSQWGLDAPVAALAAQVHQESGWNPQAVSRVGALGMAQFMPATAAWWCQANGLSGADCQPTNPVWALRALVGYDRWLWQRVHGDQAQDRMAMTLAAYNGGLGWVWRDCARARQQGLPDTRWFGAAERANAGRSAESFAENRAYPRRILLLLQPIYTTWGPSV